MVRSDGTAVQEFKYKSIISSRDNFCSSDTDCGIGCVGGGDCWDSDDDDDDDAVDGGADDTTWIVS